MEDLSAAYLLYKSIMNCGGSSLVFTCEWTFDKFELLSKSVFIFSRKVLKLKWVSSSTSLGSWKSSSDFLIADNFSQSPKGLLLVKQAMMLKTDSEANTPK